MQRAGQENSDPALAAFEPPGPCLLSRRRVQEAIAEVSNSTTFGDILTDMLSAPVVRGQLPLKAF